MPSAIEKEYDTVFGLAIKEGESIQRFLKRVVAKVDKASDDDWDQLTNDAQLWFNSARKPWSEQETIPDFPDFDDGGRSEIEEGDREANDTRQAAGNESEDDMAARKKRAAANGKKGTAAKKAAVPAKKKVHAATNGKLDNSGSSVVKRAMLKDMTLSKEALTKILKKEGFPLSPVRLDIVRSEFRNSIRVLQEDGKLREKYDF